MSKDEPLFEPLPNLPSGRDETADLLLPRRNRPRRGLWIVLGSLAGASILIAGGLYLPNRNGASAGRAKPKSELSGTQEPTPAPRATSSPDPSYPANSLSDASNSRINNLPGDTTGGKAIGPSEAKSFRVQRASSPSAASSNNPPISASQGAAISEPSQVELQELADEADKLNARASAVSKSLETLRQQQAASGLNIRGDIAAAQERLQGDLSRADSALQAGDTTNARKYLDQANAELSRIEKMFSQ